MKTFNEIVNLVESAKEDVDKFFNKDNKAAGTRVRKYMQDLKALAQQLRADVQDLKKSGDA